MKKLRVKGLFFAMLLLATLILLVACGTEFDEETTGGDTTEAVTTTETVTTTGTAPVTTTAPMTTTVPVTTTAPVTTNPHRAATEWTSDDGVHYHACADGCGIRYDEGTCGGGEATCQAAAVCVTCGTGYGEVGDHAYEERQCRYCNAYAPSEGLLYDLLNDGTYAVVGIGTCTDTVLVIPEIYEGKSVTSIGYEAFSGCSSLTTVTIPGSVTSIGRSVFSDCTSLTIYCEVASAPSGWSSDWNSSSRPVVWGYTGE